MQSVDSYQDLPESSCWARISFRTADSRKDMGWDCLTAAVIGGVQSDRRRRKNLYSCMWRTDHRSSDQWYDNHEYQRILSVGHQRMHLPWSCMSGWNSRNRLQEERRLRKQHRSNHRYILAQGCGVNHIFVLFGRVYERK